MNYDFFHEIEIVAFRPPVPRPRSEVAKILLPLGFTRHDDVVSLDRTGDVPPWQHGSIVEVATHLDGREVYGFGRGKWDRLELKYLFAFLPFELTETFVTVVVATGKLLGLSPEFRGTAIDAVGLRTAFLAMKDELLAESGDDPGSKCLRSFIESTYPRR